MSDLADALLAAHVEHELSRLRGEAFAGLIDERLSAVWRALEYVKFTDVVTPEQIVGVVERYAIELKVSGGITELVGEMSNVVFSSSVSERTRIGEICDPESYEEFADKIVSLEGVQRELVHHVTQSSAFGTLASRVLSRMVTDLVFRGDTEGGGPSLRSLVATLGRKVLPGLERSVGTALSGYVERHRERLTRKGEEHLLEALDPEWIRQMADEIWDSISRKPLADAGLVFTARDLEDFVVLGYEFWLRLRKTPYFHAVVTEVVNHLFAKYGDESLLSVITDMGISKEMVNHEILTFAVPVLELAHRTGYLEKELRAVLEPFYRSPAFAAVVAR